MTLTLTKVARLQEPLEADSGPKEGLYFSPWQKVEDNNMGLAAAVFLITTKYADSNSSCLLTLMLNTVRVRFVQDKHALMTMFDTTNSSSVNSRR